MIRNSTSGSILLEFATVLPLFLTLLFLGAEYAKFNDDAQRASYLARELLSIGTKSCGGRGSIGEIAECVGNDMAAGWVNLTPKTPFSFEARIERAVAALSPNNRVHLIIRSIGSDNIGVEPADWDGLNRTPINWHCIVPFGTCSLTPGPDGTPLAAVQANLNADEIPAGWTVGSTHTTRISATEPNIRSLIYNRCETYRDPLSATGSGQCVPSLGSGSCCGIIVAEGWVPYTPLTPVGEMIANFGPLFASDWNDGRVQNGYEIYFAVVL